MDWRITGCELKNPKQLESIVVDYYEQLFSSQNPCSNDIKRVTDVVEVNVTIYMNNLQDTPFLEEDVRSVGLYKHAIHKTRSEIT